MSAGATSSHLGREIPKQTLSQPINLVILISYSSFLRKGNINQNQISKVREVRWETAEECGKGRKGWRMVRIKGRESRKKGNMQLSGLSEKNAT